MWSLVYMRPLVVEKRNKNGARPSCEFPHCAINKVLLLLQPRLSAQFMKAHHFKSRPWRTPPPAAAAHKWKQCLDTDAASPSKMMSYENSINRTTSFQPWRVCHILIMYADLCRQNPPATTTAPTLSTARRLNLNKSPLRDEAGWKLSPVLSFSWLPQGHRQVLTRLI